MNIFSKICFLVSSRMPSLILPRNVTKKINGIHYDLDLTELIDRHIYFLGVWERDTIKSINKHIKPGMTVIEVGSNIGAHSFEIANAVGESGEVHCFEPTAYAFEKLTSNFKLNNFNNMTLNKIIVSDSHTTVNLLDSNLCFKSSWNVKQPQVSKKIDENVNTITLDHYVESKNLRKVDIVKIDTDGFEYKILMGCKKTIQKYKPILFIEVGKTVERTGDKVEDLIHFLSENKYYFTLSGNESLLSHEKVMELVNKNHSIDCICLPSQQEA